MDDPQKKRRTCKVCGRPGPHSNDHAPPLWITRMIPGEGVGLTLIKGEGSSPPSTVRESGQRHRNQVGICNACHTRFNAAVEDWGNLQLSPLVACTDELITLLPPELERLAAWCFKQVVILTWPSRPR